jgi:hypothetical protein
MQVVCDSNHIKRVGTLFKCSHRPVNAFGLFIVNSNTLATLIQSKSRTHFCFHSKNPARNRDVFKKENENEKISRICFLSLWRYILLFVFLHSLLSTSCSKDHLSSPRRTTYWGMSSLRGSENSIHVFLYHQQRIIMIRKDEFVIRLWK